MSRAPRGPATYTYSLNIISKPDSSSPEKCVSMHDARIQGVFPFVFATPQQQRQQQQEEQHNSSTLASSIVAAQLFSEPLASTLHQQQKQQKQALQKLLSSSSSSPPPQPTRSTSPIKIPSRKDRDFLPLIGTPTGSPVLSSSTSSSSSSPLRSNNNRMDSRSGSPVVSAVAGSGGRGRARGSYSPTTDDEDLARMMARRVRAQSTMELERKEKRVEEYPPFIDDTATTTSSPPLFHFKKGSSQNAVTALEAELEFFRHNPEQLETVISQITKERALVRKQDPLSNILVENKNSVSKFLPEIKLAQMQEKIVQHHKRLLEVKEKKKHIDEEQEREAIERYEYNEQRKLLHEMKLAQRKRTEQWLTIVSLVQSARGLSVLNERARLIRAENERRDRAARIIQAAVRKHLDAKGARKRAHALKVITRIMLVFVFRRRRQKKDRAADIISKFFTDVGEAFRIPLVIKRFRNAVIRVQRSFRVYLRVVHARIALLELQWDRQIAKRIAALDKKIKLAAQGHHNAAAVVAATNGDKSSPLKKRSSNTDLRQQQQESKDLNFMELSPEIFAPLVEKEELMRIERSTRIMILRENLIQRQHKFVKAMRKYNIKMRQYLKKLQFETAHNIIRASENETLVSNLVPPKKPYIKVMVSSSLMDRMIEKARVQTKALMKEKVLITTGISADGHIMDPSKILAAQEQRCQQVAPEVSMFTKVANPFQIGMCISDFVKDMTTHKNDNNNNNSNNSNTTSSTSSSDNSNVNDNNNNNNNSVEQTVVPSSDEINSNNKDSLISAPASNSNSNNRTTNNNGIISNTSFSRRVALKPPTAVERPPHVHVLQHQHFKKPHR